MLVWFWKAFAPMAATWYDAPLVIVEGIVRVDGQGEATQLVMVALPAAGLFAVKLKVPLLAAWAPCDAPSSAQKHMARPSVSRQNERCRDEATRRS